MIKYNHIRNYTVGLLFLLPWNNLVAQLWPSDEKIYEEANDYILSEEYKEALPLFQMLINKGYDTPNIKYKIGECYLGIPGQKEKALSYLKEAAHSASSGYSNNLSETDAPLHCYLLLGAAYRLHNDLDNAIAAFSTMRDSVKTDTSLQVLLSWQIQRCENAKELLKAPLKFQKDSLPSSIDDKYSNYNPLVDADGSQLYYMNEFPFYDAVMKSVKNGNSWDIPDNLTPQIGSDGDYYATGISADGKKLLLYAYDNLTSGDIYITTLSDGKWSEIKKLNDNINTKFNETHASFSPDGKRLYFTSNRPGGYGGLDIYVSELNTDGDWGPAKNLGAVINTAFNEETPFLTADGKKLFFSSQGHYNMGGYDIFYSDRSENGNWLYPLNIGYPLSTTDDDLFYFPWKDGAIGYYSEFSNEGRLKDIYRFKILSTANPARFTLKGSVDDSLGYPVNSTSQITVLNLDENKTFGEFNTDSAGNFSYKIPSGNYELIFETKGYEKNKEKVSVPMHFPENEIIVKPRMTAQLVVEKDTFLVKDIYFAFDSYRIDDSSATFLNNLANLLKKYPSLTVQINGYTDSKGKASYNLVLSERRAQTVKNYMMSKKTDSKRLTVKGHGESDPVAVNTNIDGTDNPEGRKLNRRVEIQINNNEKNLIIKKETEIPDRLKINN